MIDDRLTGDDNYFEDFTLGDSFRHARGKTVTEIDNVLLTQMVMNTADAHFNEDTMVRTPFGRRLVFGGITASIVVGLASQDASDNVIREESLDGLRLHTPVFHGDTLYATTEVLGKDPSVGGPDGGLVHFRHRGYNERGDLVCEVERRAVVRLRLRSTSSRSHAGAS